MNKTAHVVKVDDKRRIVIPTAKPGQSIFVEPEGNGWRLTPVSFTPRFPRGSLLKYLTPDRDKEQLDILKGCVLGPE